MSQVQGGRPAMHPVETVHTFSQDLARIATSACLVWTVTFFIWAKRNPGASPRMDEASFGTFLRGLMFSLIATCGNSAVGLLRKQFARVANVKPGHQVGAATLLQGVVALLYCERQGISLARAASSRSFIWPAAFSSVLNALTKTLETRAFATTDVSLCAPFLAFDPVMQFLLPTLLAPAACSLASLLCDEVKPTYPVYHPLAVLTIAASAFLIASISKAPPPKKHDDGTLATPRPIALSTGSKLILFNCAVYAVTSRLDKAAIRAADKTVYYTYGRLVMAATCFANNRPTRAVAAEFAKPAAFALLLAVCLAEAVYILALYQAFAAISPIYVTAVKRGGGLLISSLAGVLFFGEPLKGRLFPIVCIVVAVVALCL